MRFFLPLVCQVLFFIRHAPIHPSARPPPPPAAAASVLPPRPALMRVRLLALLMAAGLESLPDARLALGVPLGFGPRILA